MIIKDARQLNIAEAGHTLVDQAQAEENESLYESKGYHYMSSQPLFVKAMTFISPLGNEDRDGGAENQKDVYHHAVRTAVIAYEFGFNDEVLLHCLLHDYFSPKHLEHIPVEKKEEDLSTFCQEINFDYDDLIAKMYSLEVVHEEAKKSSNPEEHKNIVSLIRQGKISDLTSFVATINTFGALPFIVNTCEAIDNLRFPRNPKDGERVDLIEDRIDIFSDNTERIGEILKNDGMIRDAQYVLNYYLPFFEAVGNNRIVDQVKDAVVKLVSPKAFLRTQSILDLLKSEHSASAKKTFDGISELLGGESYQVSNELSSKEVAWKSVGSTVMKMLKEAGASSGYKEVLTQATIEGDTYAIGQVLQEVILSLRDLCRAKIVVNHANSSSLGDRYVKAVGTVVDFVEKSDELTFREIDVEKGEAVETSLQENRKKHAKKLREKGHNVRSRESGSEGTNIAIGIGGQAALELQILTSVMDDRNEKYGRMAHAFYKAGIPGEIVEMIRERYNSYLNVE